VLSVLVHSAVARALGWALVHSLWEGGLIALLVGVGFLLCRPAFARTRYALACFGMLAMLAAFGITLATLWPASGGQVAISVPLRFPAPPLPDAGIPAPPATAPDRLPWVVPFWMAGVLFFYARTAGGWLAAQRLRRRGTVSAPQEWQTRLHSLAEQLRVTRPVVLLETCLAETPVVMGLLRPAILIPAGLVAGLAPDQLEAILLHELAHIRRYDYAVNMLQTLVEGLLFYHPAVWWISSRVRAEREHCCDDRVVAIRGDARAYAAALAALEEMRSAVAPALAASGGNLVNRIRRLIEPAPPRPVAGPFLAAILLLVPIAVGLSAWEPQKPIAPGIADIPLAPSNAVPVNAGEPLLLVQNMVQSPMPRPLSGLEKKRNEKGLKKELETPYRKWLTEDAVYIITAEEKAAFERLQTDAERERFIEQFWLRRDPTPGTLANEFREEHYRRIAFANQHFASSIPGWKTDHGRIYIMYGPPDDIEDHSSGGIYQWPHEQGGGSTSTYPFQQWRYRYLEGIGTNVTIEFVDPQISGEYHVTLDPSEKDALRWSEPRRSGLSLRVDVEMPVSLGGSARIVTISIPIRPTDHAVDVYSRITTLTMQRVNVFEDTVPAGHGEVYHKGISLAPGRYRADTVVTDMETGVKQSGQLEFEVK
jgi:GWxTD domain-containing protein